MTDTLQPGDLITKDPQARKVYQFDWTGYLTDLDEEIDASTMTITGPDGQLTIDSTSVVTGNLKTQVRLLGGTLGKRYRLTNHITTDGTPVNEDDRSVTILIQQR